MRSTVVENCFHTSDKKINKQGRNIIFILDDGSYHLYTHSWKSEKLQFLLPDTTSKIQPLHQPINSLFQAEVQTFVYERSFGNR